MDEQTTNLVTSTNDTDKTLPLRDENKSPTSGSSSEALGDEGNNRKEVHRKHRRRPRQKRKWKPYTDLSWDERKKQDARESRRAFAKRERLSAEGHPIAPYNTTQFLMDDQKSSTPNQVQDCSLKKKLVSDSSTSLQGMDVETVRPSNEDCPAMEGQAVRTQFCAQSPHPSELQHQGERGAECRDEIQRYIMNDFSHTYAGIHAEELQSMSKMDLIAECLRLEKKIDVLEKRVKRCREKHRDEPRNQADFRLLEKINQLQVLNSQLQKENAGIQSLKLGILNPADTTSNDGAQTDTVSVDAQS